MCLSYCWGKKPFLMTTRRNIQAHKNGISIGKLPLTFQHAIEVARQLNIRYIWIDSLCIIQKDPADWEREAGKMADIYRGSYITIAATSASGPHEGFVFATRRVPYHSVNLQLIHRFKNSQYPVDPEPGPLKRTMPLLTRAWTYQERLLAPRVLHFAFSEVVYDCYTKRRCECNMTPTIDHVTKQTYFDTLIASIEDTHRSPAKTWRGIVIEYSRLKLTFSSD
jgi:hypothetical protein